MEVGFFKQTLPVMLQPEYFSIVQVHEKWHWLETQMDLTSLFAVSLRGMQKANKWQTVQSKLDLKLLQL